jgi:hypothetical protein
VAFGVVTVTVTLPPEVRFVLGETLTAADAADAGLVHAIAIPATRHAVPAAIATRRPGVP